MATALPFSVCEFTNPRSMTISYRVSGSGRAGRIRKNFEDRAAAEAFCNSKNTEELTAETKQAVRVTQTRLAEVEVAAAEAIIAKAGGRWSLAKIGEAGIAALEAAPKEVAIAPLAEEWFELIKKEVSDKWRAQLVQITRRILRDHPRLSSVSFTRELVVKWFDGLGVGQQTKAGMRNAIHRFGGWLVERGVVSVNPGAGIVIRKKSKKADAERKAPAVLLAAQADELMRAFEQEECRRLLGWASLCLFAGLRPESEAPRATWPEINLKSGEIHVEGRKRGVKPRVFLATLQARTWIKTAKADGYAVPGRFLIKVRRRAVELANEALREKGVPPITWEPDILRHTHASMRAGQGLQIKDLAEEMGTGVETIYAHYRNPRPSAEVKAFGRIMPTN